MKRLQKTRLNYPLVWRQDSDYWSKLNEEEKKWLTQFYVEYLGCASLKALQIHKPKQQKSNWLLCSETERDICSVSAKAFFEQMEKPRARGDLSYLDPSDYNVYEKQKTLDPESLIDTIRWMEEQDTKVIQEINEKLKLILGMKECPKVKSAPLYRRGGNKKLKAKAQAREENWPSRQKKKT
jgi:hypothetical protein